MKLLTTILMLGFSIGLFGQINPVFTAQVINSRRDLNGGIQIRLKSNNGFTFDSLQVGDIYAVKSGIGIARFTITGKRTTGYRPGMDGTVTLSPLDGYVGEVPLSTPTASGYVYRELDNGLIPLEYLNQDYLNWTLMNENLKTLGGSVDTNGPAIPNGEIAFGNSGGTGIDSDISLFWLKSKSAFVVNVEYGTENNPDSIGLRSIKLGGLGNSARGQDAAVIGGSLNHAEGIRSAVIASTGSYALGDRSAVIASQNSKASASRSFVGGGISNQAAGIYSACIAGNNNKTSGSKSMTLGGVYNTAYSFGEIVIGQHCTVYTPISTTGWNVSDKIFNIGNGTDSLNRSDLYTIFKSGTMRSSSYGLGNKLASTLSKTKSNYSALFATDGTFVENNISNGIYLPTVTKGVASDTLVTVYTHLYSQNDSVLTLTGRLLTNEGDGNTYYELTLPPGFTSDFTDSYNDVSGAVTVRFLTYSGSTTAQAYATVNTASDRIRINVDDFSGSTSRTEINYTLQVRKK